MANMNVNKVIYGGDVLIDLTGDSVSADKVLKGITAHDKSGAKITGTCTFDSDTSEDTAAVAEILVGKTAHARGSKLTGTMKNNGAVKGIILTVAGEYTVPQGYHDGSGKVSIDLGSPSRIALNNHELNPIFMSEILPQKSHLIIREWNVFFLDSLYFFNGIVCKLECSRIVPIYKFVFNSIVEHLIEERLYLILH